MKRPLVKLTRTLALAIGVALAAHVPQKAEAAAGDGYWSTSGAKIVDANGNVVRITGVNWFGMEMGEGYPHGIWAQPWKSLLDQAKSMGLTVIRLPYSDTIFANKVLSGTNDYLNPDLKGLTCLQLLDLIVDYCGQIGLRIFFDRHRPDPSGQAKLWYTAAVSEATWIKDMQALAARYKGNPTVIGIDLHNEPHADGTEPNSTGACWGCGDEARDWRLAAQRAGNAIHEINPELLIIVEGVSCPSGGNPNGYDDIPDPTCGWWGGNLSQAGDYPVVLKKPNKVVYSPHDYGMSVSGQQPWFLSSSFPSTLEPFWDQQWGYLAKKNIAPVLLGEFGSILQDPKDQVWLPTLLKYMQTNGISWTYWCLNPNSGDTQGLLQYDWSTIDHVRYDVIKPYLVPLTNGSTAGGGGGGPGGGGGGGPGGGGGGGTPNYSLTVIKSGVGSGQVSSSPSGINACTTTCAASYSSGTVVTLTAQAASGSTFTGWSGACSGNGTCTVTMNSAKSATATFGTAADTQPPSAPSGLSASNVTSTSVVLSWTASTDNVAVVAYDIYSGSSLAGSSNSNSATIQNLLPGTTYTFSVRARDAASNTSAASGSVAVTTVPTQDLTPPSAPSNLAWVNDNGTVTLSWSASSDNVGVVAYDLRYGNFYLGAFDGTSLAMMGFKPGTPYTFTVTARDAAGNVSQASNQITVLLAIAQDTTPPSAPTNVTGSFASTTSMTVHWTASMDDVGVVLYQVFLDGVLKATAFGSTSATISGLSATSTYSLTVKALDAAGNVSPASSPVSVSFPTP